MTKKYVAIIQTDTGEVTHKVEVTGQSERQIEKVERGVLINLNHDKYHTKVVEENE